MVRVKHLWGFFYYQKEKKSFLGYLSLKAEPPMNNAIISRQLHSSQTRLGEDLLETFVKELLSCGFGTGKALFLQHPRDTEESFALLCPRTVWTTPLLQLIYLHMLKPAT